LRSIAFVNQSVSGLDLTVIPTLENVKVDRIQGPMLWGSTKVLLIEKVGMDNIATHNQQNTTIELVKIDFKSIEEDDGTLTELVLRTKN
jgi:hypothetical protein